MEHEPKRRHERSINISISISKIKAHDPRSEIVNNELEVQAINNREIKEKKRIETNRKRKEREEKRTK